MEKWDSYHGIGISNRMHFVLPYTILEEELASANDACEAHAKQLEMANGHVNVHGHGHGHGIGDVNHCSSTGKIMPVRKTGMTDFSIQCQPQVDELNNLYGTSPTTVICSMPTTNVPTSTTTHTHKPARPRASSMSSASKKKSMTPKKVQIRVAFDARGDEHAQHDEQEEELDETDLEPAELLRRARSKLFEDLSAENGLEKGVMAYPHSLEKYKTVSKHSLFEYYQECTSINA